MLKFLCCIILLPFAILSFLFMAVVGSAGVAVFHVADTYKGQVYQHGSFCRDHPEFRDYPACR